MNKDNKEIVRQMLVAIGENPDREGLLDTPNRVVKMWSEMFRGYNTLEKPSITAFENKCDGMSYEGMIIDTGYFYSQCEHHMVPFFGQYYFAYIPDKKIIGLSKVARIVDYFSAKLQVQERLVKEIVDELEKELAPQGIALVLKGRHLCKEMRGVKKVNGEMITADLRGSFKDNIPTRQEFMSYVSK
jgi:GTP cyclohydrolase I